MSYYVSIGWPEKRGQYDKPEAEQEETAGRLEEVPFGMDTLEEARAIIAMSKSPVWTIWHGEGGKWQSYREQRENEVDCSPMVKRTRELQAQERQQVVVERQAEIDRINAQPKVVTKTYAGIAVTFTREDTDEKRVRYGARVRINAGDQEVSPTSFITGSGAIQKKKWTEWWMSGRYGTPNPERERLVALAPHLKDIAAVAKRLSIGTYTEES